MNLLLLTVETGRSAGHFTAKVQIDAFKQAAARLGLPISFGGEAEWHIPDESHQLMRHWLLTRMLC